MPTAVPFPAFSATEFPEPLESSGVVTLNSFTSLTAIVNVLSAVEPSEDVARTVILWLVALSASSEPATVTTPVLELIANNPPASSNNE